MVAAPSDIQKIAEGYRGRFYWNGAKVATCTRWAVTRTARRDDIQVLDDVMQYSKLTSVAYALAFDELSISDRLPAQLIAADNNGEDIAFSFIGEQERGDGAVSRWVVTDAYSDGDLELGGSQTGRAKTRTYSFRMNTRPVLDQGWDL